MNQRNSSKLTRNSCSLSVLPESCHLSTDPILCHRNNFLFSNPFYIILPSSKLTEMGNSASKTSKENYKLGSTGPSASERTVMKEKFKHSMKTTPSSQQKCSPKRQRHQEQGQAASSESKQTSSSKSKQVQRTTYEYNHRRQWSSRSSHSHQRKGESSMAEGKNGKIKTGITETEMKDRPWVDDRVPILGP